MTCGEYTHHGGLHYYAYAIPTTVCTLQLAPMTTIWELSIVSYLYACKFIHSCIVLTHRLRPCDSNTCVRKCLARVILVFPYRTMRNCSITAIAPRTFRKLTGLSTLLLSGNNFGELGRNIFHLLLLDVL